MHQQRFVTQNLLVSSAVPGSPGTAGTAAAPGQPRGFSLTSGCGDPAKEVRAALLPAWQGRASALPLTRRFLEGDRLLTQLSPPRRVPGLLAGSVLPPAPATAVARWSPSSPEAGSAQPEGLKRGARRLPRSPVLPRAAAPANARLSRPAQLAGRAASSDPPCPEPRLRPSSSPVLLLPAHVDGAVRLGVGGALLAQALHPRGRHRRARSGRPTRGPRRPFPPRAAPRSRPLPQARTAPPLPALCFSHPRLLPRSPPSTSPVSPVNGLMRHLPGVTDYAAAPALPGSQAPPLRLLPLAGRNPKSSCKRNSLCEPSHVPPAPAHGPPSTRCTLASAPV